MGHVSVTTESFPGIVNARIDFGLGHAPRNTSQDEIEAALKAAPGVTGVSSFVPHLGVWGVSKVTSGLDRAFFTVEEERDLWRIARTIAARG